MLIENLMIKDWISVDGIGYSQVTEIRLSEIEVGNQSFGEDKISPIPLTHEILGKNGFCYYSPTFTYHHPVLEFSGYGFCNSSALVRNGDGSLTVRIGSHPAFTIHYVHEFQHFLKMIKAKINLEL